AVDVGGGLEGEVPLEFFERHRLALVDAPAHLRPGFWPLRHERVQGRLAERVPEGGHVEHRLAGSQPDARCLARPADDPEPRHSHPSASSSCTGSVKLQLPMLTKSERRTAATSSACASRSRQRNESPRANASASSSPNVRSSSPKTAAASRFRNPYWSAVRTAWWMPAVALNGIASLRQRRTYSASPSTGGDVAP